MDRGTTRQWSSDVTLLELTNGRSGIDRNIPSLAYLSADQSLQPAAQQLSSQPYLTLTRERLTKSLRTAFVPTKT
jgi:hypothetical protein